MLPPGQLLDAMSPVQQKAALKTIAGAIRDALRAEVAPVQDPAQAQPRPVPSPPPASSSMAGPAATDSWPLQRFPSTTCLLRQEGGSWRVERRPLQVEGYREELAEGVALSMVKIPAGTFLMGSPRASQSVRATKAPSMR